MTYDIIIGRSKADKEKLGADGTIFLGKHYVTMGQTVALSNSVYMDMVRSHVVFVCGKRGGGKCVDGSTLITLHDGSRVRIEDLEHLDKDIIALDKDLKVTPSPKEGFYKRTTDKMLHVTLRSGKEIKLTPEHPLLTIRGWKPAGELMIGSRIATPRIVPFFGENLVAEHEIKILAYLIAEGNVTTAKMGFSNTDLTIVQDFIDAVRVLDPSLAVKLEKPGAYLVARADGKGKLGNALLSYVRDIGMFGKGSYGKSVPQSIFRSTKSNTSLFLNRLFSCDGTIYYDKNRRSWRISYASSSRQLIDDVQSLLLKFGILAKMRKKLIRLNGENFFSYELEISAAHLPAFLQEIGFFGKKVERQTRALKNTPKTRNPNVDTIPRELWESYRPENWTDIGRAMDYAHPKAMRERMKYAPGREMLAQIAIADHREDILKIANSDLFWDEIASIKKLTGNFEVYDITVPEHHNFVANDIIIHNSYTMGVIAEGMADLPMKVRQNLSIVMLDTMGIYWTMKYPNRKEKELLDAWGLAPKACDIAIYTPKGFYDQARADGIPADEPFTLRPDELNGSDWVATFGVAADSPSSILIERTIHDLRESGQPFGIDEILDKIARSDAEKTAKDDVTNRYRNAQDWGVFDKEGTPLSELAKPGRITVLDLSAYSSAEHGWAIKAMVTGIVSQKLFNERMAARKQEEFRQLKRDAEFLSEDDDLAQELPLVWLVIDEAHEFLPNAGKTLATDPLVTILREGRQPGISLILASQQPGKIHTDVMTQADIFISHRITAKLDTDALGMLMQSYLRTGLDKALDGLPRGSGAALILDDTNERMFPIQVRPRFTWHGGESPTALKKERRLFEF